MSGAQSRSGLFLFRKKAANGENYLDFPAVSDKLIKLGVFWKNFLHFFKKTGNLFPKPSSNPIVSPSEAHKKSS